MLITVHLHGYYDWEAVPVGVEVTPADIKAKKVKPGTQPGTWQARVNKKGDTHTSVTLPESQIIALIIAEQIKEKVALSRKQAAALYLSRHVMAHHAHKSWMHDFEVDDNSGADEELFRKTIALHIEAGNVDALDEEDLVEAYLESHSNADHVDHLHAHFGVSKKSAPTESK